MKKFNRYTNLHIAAKFDDVNMAIEAYRENHGYIHVSHHGDSPLVVAARYNSLDVARLLIQWGSKVNWVNKDGKTPLQVLIEEARPRATASVEEEREFYNRKVEFVKLLLESGATFDLKLVRTVSGLWKDQPEIMIIFIEIGKVDPKVLIHSSGEKCTRVLIEKYHVNPNLQDESGRTPAHRAVEWNDPYYIGKLKVLLEYPVDLNIKDNSGKTPLDVAVQNGNGKAVELLTGVLNRNLTDSEAQILDQAERRKAAIFFQTYDWINSPD